MALHLLGGDLRFMLAVVRAVAPFEVPLITKPLTEYADLRMGSSMSAARSESAIC
jgi:hypothetical protein